MTLSITLSMALSILENHKRDYKHPNITLRVLTILPKSILLMYSKTLVKTKGLAYFNKIKKHSKVWDYRT